MNKIWKFTPSFPRELSSEKIPAAVAVFIESSRLEVQPVPGNCNADITSVQLAITLDSFAVDCFLWDSCIFVSARMRDAMSLNPLSIQYIDIDASESTALIRSMDYKVMKIRITADVADPCASNYTTPEIYPGGPIGSVLRFPQRIAIRAGINPTHDLFHDRFFDEPFCSDELALRVLQARCTGVRFIDPARMVGDRIAFRTLRGVEEEVNWNAKKKVLRTKLVEVSTNTESGPQWSSVTGAPKEQRIG